MTISTLLAQRARTRTTKGDFCFFDFDAGVPGITPVSLSLPVLYGNVCIIRAWLTSVATANWTGAPVDPSFFVAQSINYPITLFMADPCYGGTTLRWENLDYVSEPIPAVPNTDEGSYLVSAYAPTIVNDLAESGPFTPLRLIMELLPTV